jgi:hypothetical protein
MLGHTLIQCHEDTRPDHGSASQLAESWRPGLPVHAQPRGAQRCNWLPRGLNQPGDTALDPPSLHRHRILLRFGEPRQWIAARLVACAPVVLTLEDGHGRCFLGEHLRIVQRQLLTRQGTSYQNASKYSKSHQIASSMCVRVYPQGCRNEIAQVLVVNLMNCIDTVVGVPNRPIHEQPQQSMGGSIVFLGR